MESESSHIPPDSALRGWLGRKEAKPRLSLGVSIRDLHVHGFISSTRVQPTALSYAIAIPKLLVKLFSRQLPGKVQILRDINGVVRSGEMLLVLGRPGSGCTTFLKALAGDTHGIFISEKSTVNYEGIPYSRMHRYFKGESIYLSELDVHLPELTLGQTLTFAASTQEMGPSRNTTSRTAAHDVASILGLSNAFDTWMGSNTIRGVSGGERRRTSIAEALVCGAQLQCFDNSVRGLDSATAQRFVELLRHSTTSLKMTIAMTIYQASETMYNNFDKVMVLYQGRQIYFGSVDSAVAYFYHLGFVRPNRATTPDFLTSITNPAERLVRKGYEDQVPRSPDEFADLWRRSALAKTLFESLESFDTMYPMDTRRKSNEKNMMSVKCEKLSLRASTYAIPIYLQISTCIQRQFRRIRNDPAAPISFAVANAVLALVLASVFYNLPMTSDSMDRRSVLIFFSLMLTAFMPAFEVLSIWAQRPIVEKHNRFALYHPFADSVASMVCDLPNKVLSTILFQTTIYFMTNLRRTPTAFFTWFLFNFVLVLAMSMWFRLLGSVARRREHTMAPSGIIIMLCVIYIGFVVPVPYMVDWLAWFRFVNPIAYAYESLLINEFHDRQFPCSSFVPAGPTYAFVGMNGKICPQIGAISGQAYVQGSAYIREKYSYVPGHLWRNLGILVSMTAIVCAFHLLAAEYIPARRSKGDVLRFRKEQFRTKLKTDAEGVVPTLFAQDLDREDNQNEKVGSRPAAEVNPHTIQQQSTVFHFKGLSYDIKTPDGKKRILNKVDGWVKPGTLTALMGVTGAGKTTLLDVLANRGNFGTESGEVCVDGFQRDVSFQRKIGYVQQEDIHTPTATVREALEFSALLRHPGESAEEKLEYVDNVINMLDMGAYADAIVGVPGDGLNIEKRKRLTIGVELVAKPEFLLFLDEPTSGMDSQTAWSICTLLRKLADNGQAVLCTIHQPSSQLFCMFDRLLLLNKQGETIYFGDVGPDASSLLDYFESEDAPKCRPDANPAEWVLDITSATDPAGRYGTWSQKWLSSPQYSDVVRQLQKFEALANTSDYARKHLGEYATPWILQVVTVSKRLFQEYWRDPPYLYTKVALCAGMSLLNGLSFHNTRLDIQGLTNILFSIFLVSQLFSTLNQQIILRFIEAIDLYEARERRAKLYSWTAFLAANLLGEVFWQTIAAILSFVAWYYPIGLWQNGKPSFTASNRSALCLILIWLFCIWVTTLSQCLAVGLKNSEVAIQMSTLCFWFSLVFCGVLVAPDSLPSFWTFMYHASPLTYFIDGLAVAGLANSNVTCSAVELLYIDPWPPESNSSVTCEEYLRPYIQTNGGYTANPTAATDCGYCSFSNTNAFLQYLQIDTKGNTWRNAGYFTVYVVFDVLAIFVLYWLVRVPKKKKVGN